MGGADFSIEGRTALVIGGTSGIGLEIALGFQAAGARVVVASRDANKIAASVAKLKHKDERSAGYAVDAGDLIEMRRFAAQVWSEQGPIDILLNAQGTTVIKPALEFSEQEYAGVMRTNIDGVFWAAPNSAAAWSSAEVAASSTSARWRRFAAGRAAASTR